MSVTARGGQSLQSCGQWGEGAPVVPQVFAQLQEKLGDVVVDKGSGGKLRYVPAPSARFLFYQVNEDFLFWGTGSDDC